MPSAPRWTPTSGWCGDATCGRCRRDPAPPGPATCGRCRRDPAPPGPATCGRYRVSRRPHVVVVGDVVLDREVLGRVDRISPDAPAPVLDVTATRTGPGAAGLAALLCAAA